MVNWRIVNNEIIFETMILHEISEGVNVGEELA